MTLKDKLQRELNQLTGQVAADTPAHLQMGVHKGQLACELVAVDPLACAMQLLSFSTDQLADASAEQLKSLCSSLSQKLNYLLEPISALEIDAEACVVQMRSSPPQQDDDGTSYYELVASRGGAVQLRRYNKQPGSERRVIPATVTREVFLRLADDLTGWSL